MKKEIKLENVAIRNMDASMIYNMSYHVMDKKSKKYKDIKAIKEEYENVLSEISKTKDADKLKKLNQDKNVLFDMLNTMQNKNCIIKGKDDKYFFKGTLSDSLMLSKLCDYAKDSDFRCRQAGEKTVFYTDLIINLTFDNSIMIKSGELKYAFEEEKPDTLVENGEQYETLISKEELRDKFYLDGFSLNGKEYVNFQRSSSKARTGDCLFVLKKLHSKPLAEPMIKWQRMNIMFEGLQDIVAIRAYESLPSSSIIDTIDIDPNSILLINDATGRCKENCNVVEVDTYESTYTRKGKEHTRNNKYLKVEPKEIDITMDLWDGQSLLDKSIFKGKYRDKGFILLRNHMCKSAAFQTNLNNWFKYKKVTVVKDRFGDPFDAEKIKMVTTENSMKIFKFTEDILATCFTPDELKYLDKLEGEEKQLEKEHLVWTWYKKNITSTFGICKYEKGSKFDNYQQLAYQIINSLNLKWDDLVKLAEPSINHISNMNKYPAFFKLSLCEKEGKDAKSTMMVKLLEVNNKVVQTKWYKDYRKSQIDSAKKKLKRGKLLIENNDYAVLFGNPFEMLRASVGDTINSSLHNGFECWCPKFKDGEELTMFRSPHICESNATLVKNTKHDKFDKWFHLTDNIVVVNFWGKGAILTHKLNGADTDSDAVLIGNHPILLKAVKEAQSKLVPINAVSAIAKKMKFTPENMARVDSQLANDYIGKICNYAQQLQSIYHHVKNSSGDEALLKQIFDDICILEVLSNIAIDSAKRQYDCNIGKELSRIKKRDYLIEEGIVIKGKSVITPITRGKRGITEEKKLKFDEIVVELNKLNNKLEQVDNNSEKYYELLRLKMKLEEEKDELTTTNGKIELVPDFLKGLQKNSNSKKVKSKEYIKLKTPMDILGEIIDTSIKDATRTDLICIRDILAEVKYDDASTNRINQIKQKTIKYHKQIDALYKAQSSGKLQWDKLYEKKQRIVEDAVIDISKHQDITIVDISRLIRDVYDFKYETDKNGKRVKDENGQVKFEFDKRDKEIYENKAGSYMLEWVYASFLDLFIEAIKSNYGDYEYAIEDDNGEYEDLGKRYSIVKVQNVIEIEERTA